MRLPNIRGSSCVPPGGLVLPRVNGSAGQIVLPKVEADSCILAGAPGPDAAPPVVTTLRTALGCYWQFDAWSNGAFGTVAPGGVTFPDITGGGHDLSIHGFGDNGHPGILNRGYTPANGTDTLFRVSDPTLEPGPGVSFSMQFWANYNNWPFPYPIAGRWDVSDTAQQDFLMGNLGGVLTATTFIFEVKDVSGVSHLVDSGVGPQSNGVWFHIVCGYDAALQQIWIQVDNGARVTTGGVSGVRNACQSFTVGNFQSSGFTSAAPGATIDEGAFWRRSLSLADVAALNNSMAGLPYGSFPP